MKSVNEISHDSSNSGQERGVWYCGQIKGMNIQQGQFNVRPVAFHSLRSQTSSMNPLCPSALRGLKLMDCIVHKTCVRKGQRVFSLTKCHVLLSHRNLKLPTKKHYINRCIYFSSGALGHPPLWLLMRDFTQVISCLKEQTVTIDLLTLWVKSALLTLIHHRETMRSGMKHQQTDKPAVFPVSKCLFLDLWSDILVRLLVLSVQSSILTDIGFHAKTIQTSRCVFHISESLCLDFHDYLSP